MSDGKGSTDELRPAVSTTDVYDTNRQAFEDAWGVAHALNHRFHPRLQRSAAELETLTRTFHRRLRRSPEHVFLGRIIRANRLLPDQLAVVLLILQANYLLQSRSIGEILVCATGFNPPEIDRLWRWVQRSPHLVSLNGMPPVLQATPDLVREAEGGMPIGEEDLNRFHLRVSALTITRREDIPNNDDRPAGPGDES